MNEDMDRMADKAPDKTIKDLRAALELTQERFAAKLGVTVSTVNRWETGKGKPSPLALKQIQALQKRANKSR